jgi:PTH1 family peptidyl-tRNA hydrolase
VRVTAFLAIIMAIPRLIVGLGNPTGEHEHDRHNAGFWFVDALARHHRVDLRREAKFFGVTGRLRVGEADMHLLQPMTYMNRSGQAVAAISRFYRIPVAEILVAYDELDLPPGTARFKLGGSSTHNGLRDITSAMGGPGYWRLRIGIGHPRDLHPGKPVVDFVLDRPSRAHKQQIDDAIDRAIDVVPIIARDEWPEAMKQLHTVDPAA